MKKNWLYVKRGLLSPEHIKKLGPRWALYLYMVDLADWDDGGIADWKDRWAAEDIGEPIDTVRKQRIRLAKDGYITFRKGQHSLEVTVNKWIDPRRRSSESLHSPSGGHRQDVPESPTVTVQTIAGVETLPLYQQDPINYSDTPVLDSVFGERPKPESQNLSITNWPNVEAPIQSVLDAFEKAMGEGNLTPGLRRIWVSGAREFVQELGEKPDLVGPAVEQMRNDGLTIKSPRSLITIARNLRSSRKTTDMDWMTKLRSGQLEVNDG